ncbi:MAG TPA: PilZ domain-containing protein [Spirochaetota bacterium]|nr:PilZ domain-containing protein [Spirochaetota bacterium]HPC39303.1 PilZ domain-containing protein [Spirochaetota bacterium]HQF08759.1 PilZ domain-containing protein [Spirochaetota bacterium]HQH97540.1 PilZ domain-containing protein [Spirochaetota bacterium]HQJ71251.1 PilZ domain-containing protein [Spirochaetota bacterium]
MTNNRKHVRVSYEKQVELIAEGQTLVGKSIDISNSGIRVVVNVPVSHLTIERIAFNLPLSPEVIHLPCKIVRSNRTESEEGHVLGIEFSDQTETQMILIDNFIRNSRRSLTKNDAKHSDLRVIPRISCNLTGVSCDNQGIFISSIDNISTEGCLVSYKGSLNAHDGITLSITLPGDRRRVTAAGFVTYVIQDDGWGMHRAGVCFSDISDIDSIRIRNFILKSATSTALRTLQERRNEHVTGNENLIRDPEKIAGLFRLLKKEKRHINVLFEKSIAMFVLMMKHVDARCSSFATSFQKDIGELDLKKRHEVYFSFYLHGSSYYFASHLMEAGGTRLIFSFPAVLHQSDKRSYARKYIGDGIDVFMELDDMPSVKFNGKVENVSRRGFLCNVKLPPLQRELVKLGQPVSYYFNRDMGLDTFGEIRHIKEVKTDDGTAMLQLGIEAGIRRADVSLMRFGRTRWDRAKAAKQRSTAGAGRGIVSEVVRYRNREGKEIVALLNHTGSGTKAPVVILPPAFGKKKETLSPFVATLLENFRKFDKDLVVIRYDGINRPGESCQDGMCPKRGYEMLNYRISQGLDDLEATMDYAHHNKLFRPTAVIVVAFSMSALDARKLAVKDSRVTYLVNVMGITCARSSFNIITGGIDIIDNARNGIQSGLSGVLGHILDLDTIAKDLIENRYAYLADARHDMSRISIPVSWIYGKYDRWVVDREILDLMSVRAKGPRDVIEIPTGHNLRSSEDALLTFKIITRMIYRHLHHRNIRPVDPDRSSLVSLITCERERLYQNDDVNIREYWKDYLIGENRNSVGYDFYRNFDEFREFLSVQGSLLDLKNGEIMADMGCGTGIFMERMLLDRAEQGVDLSRARLVQVDLVSEALARTREKYLRIKDLYGAVVPQAVDFIQMDLEPNRLVPVKRFIEDKTLDYDYLRNRVEGLKNTTIDRLVAGDSGLLRSLMRGAAMGDYEMLFLRDRFSDEDCRAIIDFNRAARFLLGRLFPLDIGRAHSGNHGKSQTINHNTVRTDDLVFSDLRFGSKGLALNLSFRDSTFDKIAASLLISYLFNPDEILNEFYRILKPDGRLLVSSMRPDGDISVIFTNYINKVWKEFSVTMTEEEREKNLTGARAMLNEAASLLELEEDGHFRFYSDGELCEMLGRAGFVNCAVTESLGDPPQVVIVTGAKPGVT